MTKSIPMVGEAFLGDNPYVVKVLKIKMGLASASPDVTLSGATVGATDFLPTVVTVPAGIMVHDVGWFVEEAFTAGWSVTIGDSDSVAGYAAATDVGATVKDTNVLFMGGYLTADTDVIAPAYAGGRMYGVSNGMDISLVLAASGTAAAVGILDVFIVYSGVAAGVVQTS
mgnify:FL=1